MSGSPLQRVHDLLASARILARFDPEAREALRLTVERVADENVRARRSATIHPTAYISPFASLRFTERVEVRERANIASYCAVWGGWSQAWARVGVEAHIGSGCVLAAGNHAWDEPGSIYEIGMREADVVVDDGANINPNSVIVGCRVGKYAVVGANSVVLSDVPDNAIVVGAPARVVKMRPAREAAG